jgi:hypothetical protein
VSLCPEFDKRAAMTDGEFWSYVLQGIEPGQEPDGYDDDYTPDTYVDLGICAVCGSSEACGYDTEGRPWIHATYEEVEP